MLGLFQFEHKCGKAAVGPGCLSLLP